MQIKDIPKDMNLVGIKFKTPDGAIGYIKSAWQKGLWYTDQLGDSIIHPLFFDDSKEILELEVIE